MGVRFEIGGYRAPRQEWSGQCCVCRKAWATLKIWPGEPDPGLYCNDHRPQSYIQATARNKEVSTAIYQQSKRWMDELMASKKDPALIPLDLEPDLFQQKE